MRHRDSEKTKSALQKWGCFFVGTLLAASSMSIIFLIAFGMGRMNATPTMWQV
jgi:hypothetical protein